MDVASYLRRQHGLITRAQALTAGLTPRQIQYLVECGRWSLLARGIYRVATTPVTYEQKALAAVLASGPGTATSHRTAGALHHLAGIRPGRIHITVPHGRRGCPDLAVVHRTRNLDAADLGTVQRIPCTSVARTIVDLAATFGDGIAPVLDEAVIAKRTTLAAVRASLARAAVAPGRTGTASLAKALQIWTPGPVAESIPEIELARRLHAAGLPIPERQYVLPDPAGGTVGRFDLAYPWWTTLFEHDSDQHHKSRAERAQDARRRNRAQALGWRVLVQVTGGDDVVATAVGLFLR